MKYLFAKRIIKSSNVRNIDFLLKEEYLQVDLAFFDDIPFRNGDFVILDFGKEISGGIRILTSQMSSDGKIRIRFGESISESCSDIGPESGATNDHSPRDFEVNVPHFSDLNFGQTGFRFVRIDFTGEFWNVQHIVAAVDLDTREEVGVFQSDDKLLNDIWNVASYTLRLNLHNGLVWDGVKRDRLCWIGDSYNEIKALMCLYDKQDEIANVVDYTTTSIKARLLNTNTIPSTYSLWWILNFFAKYEHDFDKEYLFKYKPFIKDIILNILSYTKDNGDIILPRGFIDWPSHPLGDGSSDDEIKKNDEMVGIKALTLMTYQKILNIFGNLNDHTFDELLIPAIEVLEHANYDVKKFRQCAAFVYYAGKENEKTAKVLTSGGAKGLSTFQSYFILSSLAEHGMYDDALNSLKEYYGAMLSLGATSFFEDFDVDWAKNANRIDELLEPGKIDFHLTYGQFCYKKLRHSLAHGWGVGVIPYIVENIIGLKQVGLNEFSIQPHMSYLKHINYIYPLKNGRISIEINNNNGKYDIKIDCPKDIKVKII